MLRLFFLKDFIYLFLERGEGREKEKEKHRCARETSISCLLHAPTWGPGLQPRHVLWLGIELVTFWFTDQHSIHWATPARSQSFFSYSYVYSSPTQISMSIPSHKTFYWSIWNPQSPHWMFLLPLCSGGRMYVTDSATALLTGSWDTHTCFSHSLSHFQPLFPHIP